MPVANTPAGIATMNAILGGWLGPDRSTLAPDSYVIRAWFDNPAGDSPTEVDFAGYAPAELDSDDWEAADGGEVVASVLVDLGTPTTSSTDAARYWSMHDTVTDAIVYSAPLATPTYITAGGDAFQIRPIIPFGGRS